MNTTIDRLLTALHAEVERLPNADAELSRLIRKAHQRLMEMRRGR